MVLSPVKNRTELFTLLKQDPVDVLVIADTFSRGAVASIVKDVHDRFPALVCLHLSDDSSLDNRVEAIDAGFRGCLSRQELDEAGVEKLFVQAARETRLQFARETESMLHRMILNNQGEGTGLIDDRGVVRYANPALERIVGAPPGEMVGKKLADFLPDLKTFVSGQLKKRRQGLADSYNLDLVGHDGVKRRVHVNASPWSDPHKGFSGSVVVIWDITEQVKTEGRLRERDEQYRLLARNIPQTAVFLFDRNLRYTLVEGQLLKQTGFDPEKIVGRTAEDILPEETYAILKPIYEKALAGKTTTFRHWFGDRFYQIQAVPLKDSQDTVAGMLISQDITESEKVKSALLQANREWERTFNAVPVMLTYLDNDRKVVKTNEVAAKRLGLHPAEMEGVRIDGRFGGRDIQRLFSACDRAMNSGDAQFEVVELDTFGGIFQVIASPVYNDDGELDGVLHVARDITTIKRAEKQLYAQIQLGRLLSSAETVDEALGASLNAGVTASGFDSGGAYRLSSDAKALELTCSEGWSDETVRALDKVKINTALGKSLLGREPSFELTRGSQRTLDSAFGKGTVRSVAIVPIRPDQATVAGLLFVSSAKREGPEDGRGVLPAIGTLTGNAVARILADEARRKTAEYYQAVVDSQNDMVVRVDVDGRYTFVNDAFCRRFGESRDELIGSRFMPLVHEEDRERTLRMMKELEKPPYRIYLEQRAMTVDGWRWIAWEDYAIRDASGRTVEVQGVGRDITEQKEMRLALEESEAKLRAVFNNNLQGFIFVDPSARILAFNRLALVEIRRVTGKALREGKSIFDQIPRQIRPRFRRYFKHALQGKTIRYELPSYFRDGGSAWFEIQMVPVLGEKGEINGVVLGAIDITDLKQALQALERSEQRFRSLVQNSSDIITIVDPEGVARYLTQAAEKVLGYKISELVGHNVFHAIHPEDQPTVRERFEEVVRDPEANMPVEFRFRHKDGHWVYLEAVGTNLLHEPDIHGVVITSRDLTERRRSEERLRLLAAAIATAEEAVLITDAELDKPGPRIVFVNEGFCRMSGYTAEEVMGQTPRIMQGPKTDRSMLDRLKVEIAEGNTFYAETVNYRKDGSEYIVEWHISPVVDPTGRITHYVSIQRDITERKEFEEQLTRTAEQLSQRNIQIEAARREADRAREAVESASEELRRAYEDTAEARLAAEQASEAKSQFLASMSHEIRTPMTAILGFAKLFRGRESDPELNDFAEQIISAGEHLLELINDILDLSRVEAGRVKIQPEPMDMQKLLDEVIELYSALAEKKGIDLKLETDRLPPRLLLDQGRVRQIITNLVANAIKFTDHGGVLLRVERLKKPTGIRIVVEDSGKGIPPSEQEQIFEPFYQVREKGQAPHEGTGLGLAITSRLTQAMEGSLTLESEVGRGTRFTIDLPCSFLEESGVAAEAKARTEPEEKPDTGMKVLVADDHPANRMLIQHVLERRGHTVTLAEDGAEAIDRFREEAFDVIVLDVQMPRVDGYEATHRIRSLPGGDRVPILCLTAYAMSGDREKSLAAGADDYLSKPFDPDNLADRVIALATRGVVKTQEKVSDPAMDALRRQYLADLIATAEGFLEVEPTREELRVWAHRIAGSGGSFGYQEITAIGRMIEHAEEEEANSPSWVKNMIARVERIAQEALEALGKE